MNCEQIKEMVSIRRVLESFNLFPVKQNSKTAFYFAIDREEKTPSFCVDFAKNKAFDFGTGKSYDVVSIVQQLNLQSYCLSCSVLLEAVLLYAIQLITYRCSWLSFIVSSRQSLAWFQSWLRLGF